MSSLGVVGLFTLFAFYGHAHNIKLLKSQGSDLRTTGIETAINNESYLQESDTFLEGFVGFSKTDNSRDSSTAENRTLGLSAITPKFFSFGLNSSTYENSYEELKTRTLGFELGKKNFYGIVTDSGFTPNFGFKVRVERVSLDQSKTFIRRKFEFNLEQTSSGLSLSLAPRYWFEVSTSYYRHRYNEDIGTIKSNLSRSEILSSLFSNVQNTLDSLSETSRSVSFRLIPSPWLDATVTRTFSDDLVMDTQYYVDSFDVGIYYFSSVYLFLAIGDQYSSIDSSKNSFSEFSIQFNF